MKALDRIFRPLALILALLLLGISGYDLSVRADALLGPVRIIARMAAGEGMGPGKVLEYIAPEMNTLWVLIHLLCCAGGSLAAAARLLFGRGRLRLLPWIFLTLGIWGHFLSFSLFAAWTRSLRQVLLFLLAGACLLLSLPRREGAGKRRRRGLSPREKGERGALSGRPQERRLPAGERPLRRFEAREREEHVPLWPRRDPPEKGDGFHEQ